MDFFSAITVASLIATPLCALAVLVIVIANARSNARHNREQALWSEKIGLLSARAVLNRDPSAEELAAANALVKAMDEKYGR